MSRTGPRAAVGQAARTKETALDPSGSDVEVVRHVVDAFRKRDIPRLRSLFHEYGEFKSAITAVEGGTYSGLEEMERYLRDLDAVFEDWRSEDEEFVDGGDGRVALVFRVVGRGRESGVPVDQPIAIVWTVRDGKVASAHGYLDPEEARARVCGDHPAATRTGRVAPVDSLDASERKETR